MSANGLKYLFIILAIIFLNACSPEGTKKTLNFFFDGVPGEEVEQIDVADSLNQPYSSTIVSAISSKPQNIYHLPYLEKECASCHDWSSFGKYVLSQPRLCYQCHEIFKEKYNVMHGPAAGGYCTSCHHPHFSKEKALLIRTGQKLCLY